MRDDDVEMMERVEAEYLFSRVKGLQELPGNPYMATTFGRGKKISFLVAKKPDPMNSRICGVDLDNPVLPKNALAEFHKTGTTIYIPVVGKPAQVKAKSLDIGATPLRGWTHGQFVADVKELPETALLQRTRQLKVREMVDFVNVHSNVFRYSKGGYDMALAMFVQLLKTKNAEAFAIDIDGKPVAIGLIYFSTNKVGYLATAATYKSARLQGAHGALIARRIEAARKRNMNKVSATALLNSQSHRNLQKAGLKLSHIQTLVKI